MRNKPLGFLALFVLAAVMAAACGGATDSMTERADPPTQDDGDAIDGGDDAGDPAGDDSADPADDPETPTTEPPVEEPTDELPPEAGGADWTVMVYVMGDNDLEPFAVFDMLEMAAVGSSDRVNIVALVDRAPGYIDEELGGIEDFQDTRFYFVEPGNLVTNGSLGELNTGDPAVLAEFITTSITNFPADHYATILWNHGAGWPGMGPDETDGQDLMDLAEINQAFTTGLAAAGVDNVDLVGFDACLMASYEVATTMADHADFMLASEELEPGHGWNYEALQTIVANPDAGPEEFGRGIIDGFVQQAVDSGTESDITLSLLDLRQMGALETALADLAAPLMAEPQAAAPILAQAQAGALAFATNPDPNLEPHQVDLGNVAVLLGQADPVLEAPAAAVVNALDAMVVANTTGPASSAATGLSIYFPPTQQYFRQGYLFLEDIPVWPDLLTSFYTAGEALPEAQQASFVNTGGDAEYFFDEDGLNIFGTFDLAAQDNLVEAEIFYGVLDENDGSIIFIGEEPGEVATDGSGLAAAIYDLTVLTISDGIDTDFAYLDLTIDAENQLLLIDVPLWYFSPEAIENSGDPVDVVLSLVLDFEGFVESEVYYAIDPDSGTFAELIADPTGLIFPIVFNVYPDGSSEWVTLSEVGLFANLPDLQYALEPLDPGTGLYAELVISDYGGNTDVISMFDTVPG